MEKVYRWWFLIHWVIGNGESRKNIDISKLEGVTYGCNAIYRDYFTDFLFCKDKGISNEVTFAKCWQDRRVYFQHRWRNDSEVREAYNRICYWDKDYPDCGTAALRTATVNACKYLNDEWKYPEKTEVETFELYPQMKFVQYGNWADELNEYENVRLAWYFV